MTGSWNGTVYNGDSSNDIAVGTEAGNTMYGNQGDDALDGAGGDDRIDGGVGSDNLQGGAGNDIIWDYTGIPPGFVGPIGHDTLRGGDGDDQLNFWSPDTGDVAIGGDGFDTLEIRFNYGGLVVNGAVSFVLGRAPSVVQYDGINTVAVSQMERMLFVANNGNDFVTGGEFNDTISGLGGNDVLSGQDGDDWLDGGTGVQDMDGGKGIDRASFDLSAATEGLTVKNAKLVSLGAWGAIKNCEYFYSVITGSGNDTITLEQAYTAISSGGGDDKITMTGLAGHSLSGGAGNDTINTSDGNDQVDPGAGSDVVKLGGGNDRMDYATTGVRTSTEGDAIYGGAGSDTIWSAAGADYITGEDGADWVFAGAGADTVLGGIGNDTLRGEGGSDSIRGGDGNDTIDADRDFVTNTTPLDNERLYGEGGNDTVVGGVGYDTLDGGAGDDTLSLGFATDAGGVDNRLDKAFGGDGFDVLGVYLPYPPSAANLKLVLGATTSVKVDGQVIATATGMEALYVNAASAGTHTIVGGANGDTLFLGKGASSVQTLGGNDLVTTGNGSDTVDAGTGNDSVSGYMRGDDDIQMGEGDDLLTIYDFYIADDLIDGMSKYVGGVGTDKVELWLTGTPGSSFDGRYLRYNGNVVGEVKGFETIIFHGSTGGFAYGGTNNADNIDLKSGDNDISGLGGADTIMGYTGMDTIDGGTGDDRLTGGGGADRLTGGTGGDNFIYTAVTQSGGAAIDLITDFGAGDRIDLLTIDADAVLTGNQAFHLGGGGGHAGDIVVTYDSGNNRTVIDLYVDDNASIDGTIWLAGDHSGLTLGDFIP